MWLRELRIRSFGGVRDQQLELAAGLNIVHGPNESAKSTWHAGLTVGLCGRRRGAGRRQDDARFEARHRPWDDDDWALALVVVLDDGRVVEIDRDLAQQRTTIEDDIIRDGSPDGALWLGLDRTTFPVTASVRQAELLAIAEQAEGLRGHLARAASGGTGVTAAAAIERLVRFQREYVGVEKVNAVKPLRKAMDAVALAEADLDATRARHHEYQQLVAAVDRSRHDVELGARRLRVAEATVAVRRRDEARRRLADIEVLAAVFPEGEPPALDAAPTAAIARAVERYRTLSGVPITDLPPVEGIRAEIAALPGPPTGPVEVPPEVADRVAAHRAALDSLVEQAPEVAEPVEPSVEVVEVQAWAEVLRSPPPPSLTDAEAVAAEAEAERRRRAAMVARSQHRAVACGVGALAGLGLLAAPSPVLRVIGVVVSVLLGVLAVRSARAASRRTVIEPDASIARLEELRRAHRDHEERLEEVRRRLRAFDLPVRPDEAVTAAVARHLARGEARAVAARHRAARDLVEARRAEACRALEIHGVHDSDPVAGFAELRRRCEEQAVRARAQQRRERLEAELAARLEHDAALVEYRRREAEAVGALVELTAAHGVAADRSEPDALVDELDQLLARWSTRMSEQQQAHEQWGRFQAALGGASLDERRREVELLERDAGELLAASDGEVLGGVDPEPALEQARSDLAAARERMERNAGALSGVDAAAVDVAGAEARLSAATDRLAGVRRLQGTLENTRHFLERAHEQAHRVLAPRLEEEMTRWVPTVTGGRYVSAQVDPETLAIRLRGADGKVRDASLVSHGTAEQVHLVLRVVLADLLTYEHERCPVLLDEPTVHADPRRTAEVLEFLRAVSRRHQVVVFSQEAEVASWAEERLDPDVDRLVRLSPVDRGEGPSFESSEADQTLRSVR
jgi:hypothetical protein